MCNCCDVQKCHDGKYRCIKCGRAIVMVDEEENFKLITEVARTLNMIKGFEVGYSNPGNGKMIINHDDCNFLVTVEPLNLKSENKSLSNAMREFAFIFKDK